VTKPVDDDRSGVTGVTPASDAARTLADLPTPATEPRKH
jgi:hypothetical protein